MRHGKKVNHLGRKKAHRVAMLANMACSLIEHKRINTTVAKAKALKQFIEPLITKSKAENNVTAEKGTHNRRVVFKNLRDKYAVTELFSVVSEKVADRPGGYTRIIKLADERNPVGETHRKWMGDSIGRWEGDTLVVETKFFNSWHTLRGMPVENLTLIETFRRESDYKVVYGFTVDDPTVFTAQFSGEYPLSRIDEPLYEYACHEGNYGMTGILAGARQLEVQGD